MRVTELAGQIKAFVLGWIDSVLSTGGRDLGSPTNPFGTIYAEGVTADELLGTLAGNEWQHGGDMIIDANSDDDTVVSVVNQGPGVADFFVERNIALGGTVDGVDVAAHAANANAHHAQQHGLDGSDHTGTLSWSKVSKSGSNLADLATRAHSSLTGIGANDHHNQSHVLATNAGLGADHTISGATAGHVLRASSATAAAFAAIQDGDLPSTIVRTSRQIISGNGLTGGGNLSADRTLAVGAGSGITVTADAVALTTPGSLSATSSNNSVGSHTHAIDSTIARSAITISAGNGLTGGGNLTANRTLAVNQDYDFNWTGLHTFNEHTEMESVDVNGALTVFDDLTVFHAGFYPLFVNVDTVNPNNSNVGIMTNTPDPQFALDVAGPLRAQYLIGPHAIQLSDAAMIVHYDGPYPFETNFDGSAVGHLGQVATVTGGVIYRPGKFGKAVQLAEATTNLCLDPSFEHGTLSTHWTTVSGSPARSTSVGYVGSASLSLGATFTAVRQNFTVISSTVYQATVWARTDVAGSLLVLSWRSQADNTVLVNSGSITLGTQWTRYTLQLPSHNTTTGVYVQIQTGGTVNGTVFVDAVQVEQKAYITPYCDGSLGPGHSWSGTAHVSTSARTNAYLSYPTVDNISAEAGTVMAWVYVLNTRGGSNNTILRVDGSGSSFVILRYNNSAYRGYWGATAISGGTPKFNQWVHLAVTFDGATVKIYENGIEVATGAMGTAFAGMPANIFVGANPSGSENLNGYLDDLVILSRAVPADEIRAIYESDAPLFAESSIEVWRTPTQVPIWVDSEGLWMRAVGGGETLGAYGGDATKSWGGRTLYQSDFLLGNATDGYIHWHAFQDDSDPWGAAGMEVKAQVDIIGDSTITGDLTIDGGALYAGGGDVRLDADGISIIATQLSGPSTRIEWTSGGVTAAYVSALHDTGYTVAGTIVDDFDHGWFEVRANGDLGGKVTLMASAGGAGSFGDPNVFGAALILSDDGTEEKITMNCRVDLTATNAAMILNRLTTTQRNALFAIPGMIIYNSTDQKVQARTSSAWVNLH